MASIKKIGKKYKVIYYYKTKEGEKKQKWDTFNTEAEAMKRKLEVELAELEGTLFVPSEVKFEDFFNDSYVPTYAKVKWKYKTYDTNMAIFKNHILPYIGEKQMKAIKPRDVENLFALLSEKKVGNRPKTPEEDLPYLSPTTINYTHVLLKKAMSKAVEWQIISKSPVLCAPPDTADSDDIAFWEPDVFAAALNEMRSDPLLHLAVHLSFKATLRIGEALALTFDCIDFEKRKITINKTLQRVTKEALKKVPPKDLIYVFPDQTSDSKSSLILKRPKSKDGVRTNYISQELCNELLERQKAVIRHKVFHDKQYATHGFDFVLCFDDGRPIEPGRCSRWFSKWQKTSGLNLEPVVFHSIRHTSTSYKLALSGGDIKAVQSDLGDATAHMVTGTYGHVINSRKEALSEKFDEEFYKDNKNSKSDEQNTDLLKQLVDRKLTEDPSFLEKILRALDADYAQTSAN